MLQVTARRLLLLLAICAPALLAAPAAAEADAQRPRCVGAGWTPTAANLETVRAAVLCLHNRVRAARGLPALKQNLQLRAAAEGHSRAMVDDRFFAHETPGGADMVDRIMGAGYADGGGWAVGENIAWATGHLATAAQIQRAWMRSPGHRANILRSRFREIGIGVAVGAPVRASGGATYTADFGFRR